MSTSFAGSHCNQTQSSSQIMLAVSNSHQLVIGFVCESSRPSDGAHLSTVCLVYPLQLSYTMHCLGLHSVVLFARLLPSCCPYYGEISMSCQFPLNYLYFVQDVSSCLGVILHALLSVSIWCFSLAVRFLYVSCMHAIPVCRFTDFIQL